MADVYINLNKGTVAEQMDQLDAAGIHLDVSYDLVMNTEGEVPDAVKETVAAWADKNLPAVVAEVARRKALS